MTNLPTGTVTFLFTDIEGSTLLLQRLRDRYSEVLETHRRLLREVIQQADGYEFGTQGDGFFVAFPTAQGAVKAAVAGQRALHSHAWPEGTAVRVRMAVHTGQPTMTGAGYVGLDLHRTARICSAAAGGQILLSQTARDLAEDGLPDGVGLRDLGAHRLKDLTRPQRLFQVVVTDLPADFSPLKSLDTFPNNLPIQLTSFVGREREKAEVKRLLSTTRLVTLTGTGGAGKTRLALQAAAEMLDEVKDGVWLVELAPLSEPVLLPKTVTAALGLPEPAGRPVIETLADYLRPRSVLLVLDNCEHLLTACAHLAVTLLRACPRLRILATSREALDIEGETRYRVPSLSLPPAAALPLERLNEFESVRLFIERATAALPSFVVTTQNAEAVGAICQQLDGIPLAIELAAARVKVLSVPQIAERLDDRFRLLTGGSRTSMPQHQTLRAAMDWSYELLSEQERILFRRLSVFAGGWTLEASESICAGDTVEAPEILDLLTQVADKSLVMVETQGAWAWYRLLETVRQYARDRLTEAGETPAVRMRHRDWYLDLAERAERELRGPGQGVWLERLEREHDNLRLALEWSMAEHDGAHAGLRLAGALHWFWFVHGHWSEGRRWLDAALTRSADAPAPALLKALQGVAFLAYRQGNYRRATAVEEQGLAMARKLGDRGSSALFLITSGLVALRQGDYRRATAQIEESLVLSRQLEDTWLISLALGNLGAVARHQHDYRQAEVLYEQSLALSREVGDKRRIAYSLRNLGIVALHRGDDERAGAFFIESLSLVREFWDPYITEGCVEGLAALSGARGHHMRAARLLGASEALCETFGLRRAPPDQADHDRHVASTRAGLRDAAFAEAWAEGRAMTLEEVTKYAIAGDA